MSEEKKYTAGLHNVGSYQVAGIPYVTSSTVSEGAEKHIKFPKVTNNITVKLDSAAGGAGTEYNSLRISGSTYLSSSTNIYNGEGLNESYSVSMWLRHNGNHTVGDSTILFSLTGNQARSVAREKKGSLNFIALTTKTPLNFSGVTATISNFFKSANANTWMFCVFVARDLGGTTGVQVTASVDGVNQQAVEQLGFALKKDFPTDGQSYRKFFVGGALQRLNDPLGKSDIEHTETPNNEIFVRDMILWDGALTEAQITTLYNGGNYFDFSSFTDLDKQVWIKPDDSAGTSYNGASTINNFGSTGSVMRVNHYDAGTEIVEVSADAPFADIPGSNGEIRVHYRSTGSLPNVAANKHYWTLDTQYDKINMNVKTKEIYLSAVDGDCDFSLQADLTNISTGSMYQHTGSGVDE